MKKLLTTACLFVVTAVAIVSFIAPVVFGQGKKRAKGNPSPAKAVQQAQIKAGMDPQRLARIPVRMREFVDGGLVAGAVTLVARHGEVALLEAVGYQDLESKKPMRIDSIFQIRSMTKPITAVGIMILLEEGCLRLSDPVEQYVPEFRDQLVVDKREGEKVLTTKKPSRPITIRDLLTHTSGIVEEGDKEESSKTLAEYIASLSQEPLEFEPGTKFSYSDVGFDTLGRVIEVASGQPYEKFIEQRILKPLMMKASSFFPSPEKNVRIVSRHKLENGKLKKVEDSLTPVVKVRYPGPSWTMFSTASDMAAFHQMMLNAGTYKGVRILSRASVEAMTALQTGDFEVHVPWAYGLGWGVNVERPTSGELPLVSIGAYGHPGILGTFGWVDPKRDLVGIFMVQRDRSPARNAMRETFIAMTYAAIVE